MTEGISEDASGDLSKGGLGAYGQSSHLPWRYSFQVSGPLNKVAGLSYSVNRLAGKVFGLIVHLPRSMLCIG